jgi:formiminotetrahydrofolate cyclodeaminase
MGLAAGATAVAGAAGAALSNGVKALSGDKKNKSGAYDQQTRIMVSQVSKIHAHQSTTKED